MRNLTLISLSAVFLVASLWAAVASASGNVHACDGAGLSLGQGETLTYVTGELTARRVLRLPSPGTLVAEVVSPVLDGATPWLDIDLGGCSDIVMKSLDAGAGRRVVVVDQPGTLVLEAGWLAPSRIGLPVEVLAHFIPAADGTEMMRSGGGNNADGDGTGEADNEILPLVDPDGQDADGDGTGEADNEILPLVDPDGQDADGDGTGEADNEILPLVSPDDVRGLSIDRAADGFFENGGTERWAFRLEEASLLRWAMASDGVVAGRLSDSAGRILWTGEELEESGNWLLPSGAYLLEVSDADGSRLPYSLLVSARSLD